MSVESGVGVTRSSELSVVDIDCKGESLMGIHHHVSDQAEIGVVVVVGGRQYRVGAHRQYVLLARALADSGVPVLRFDVRGMGDSHGEIRHFLEISDDIRAAVDAMLRLNPGLDGVALWGLCDGATASILYASGDARICGAMLVNPWVSTDAGQARSYLRHYYLARLKDPGLWRKLRQGKLDMRVSVRSALLNVLKVASVSFTRSRKISTAQAMDLPTQVFDALDQYDGHVHAIISEHDLTAREFEDALRTRARRRVGNQSAKLVIDRVVADHTFSTTAGQQRLFELTRDWIGTVRKRELS